jgi:hypothetical protein
MAILGGWLYFADETFRGIPMYLATIAVVLVINGIFLSFSVSPYLLKREKEGKSAEILPKSWQTKIMISLLFSDLGWWGSLLLVIWYITH